METGQVMQNGTPSVGEKQKASLNECVENQGPSQLGPNPLVSDRFLTGAHETWRLVSLGPVY